MIAGFTVGEVIAGGVGVLVVATEWVMIASLRETTREIRQARQDVPRSLALLALANSILAAWMGRFKGQGT